MPVIIDKAGNRHEYLTLREHGASICLDGDRFIQGTLADFTVEAEKPTTVTSFGFKRLFTSAERVAIKNARVADDLVEDFFSMVEDPDSSGVDLTLQSTLDALLHLKSLEIITDDRRLQILGGVEQ